ncbi:MAG: ATP-binding protein [Candidatus Limnocylindria bacterium]
MTVVQAAGEHSPFVGRSAELRRLGANLQSALRSHGPRTVVVVGEAGVGKSRLIREFVQGATLQQPELAVLQGRCPAGGSGSAYWPLAEALREASGTSLAQDTRTAAASLRAHLEGLFPSGGEELVQLIQALAVTASLTVPDSPLERAEPQAVDAAVLRAWPIYLGVRGADHGAIVVIEDIHWADPQLLRVIRSIHRDASAGLLLILTARPELTDRHADFVVTDEGWTSLTMSSLAPPDAELLVRKLLQAPQLGPALAGAVARRAEGNPLYIEETIRLLTDTGAVRIHAGATEVLDTARLVASPASITGLLAARIAALPADERRVIQAAAIVGRRFWNGAVAQALRLKSVRTELGALEGRGLVHRRATSLLAGQTEYVFKHALIRDAAYEAMSRSHRARAHAAVGAWLESIAGDRIEAVHEFVAEHYRHGVQDGDAAQVWDSHPDEREALRERALRHLLTVGAAARRGYALDRAVALHGHAMDLAATATERARALEEIAEDHETGLRGEEAMSAYLEALEVAREATVDPDARARICMKAARTLVMRWGAFSKRPDPTLMDALIDEGLAAASDPATRCWLLALNGGAAVRWRADARTPDPISLDERLRRTRIAVEAAPGLDLPDLAGMAGRIVGQLEFEDGRFDDCRATMRAIRPHLGRMDSKFQRAITSMYVFLAMTDVEGRYAEAVDLAGEMLELGRGMSPHEHMHGTFAMLWVLDHLGRWGEMPPLVDEHLATLEGEDAIVCPYVRSGPLVGALTLAHLGDDGGVSRITDRVRATWDAPGLPEMLLARIATAQGRPAEGASRARQMIDEGRQPNLEENAFDVVGLIEALLALEDWDGLRDVIRGARRWEPAMALMRPTCDRADGLIALANGDRGPGITSLIAAAGQFGRLGLQYEVARTKALLAQAMPEAADVLDDALAAAGPLMAESLGGLTTTPAMGAPPVSERLSDRELEVLGCVAEGLSNQRIADRLSISVRTVERHLSNIYSKLGVEGKAARAAATAHAFQHGLVERLTQN